MDPGVRRNQLSGVRDVKRARIICGGETWMRRISRRTFEHGSPVWRRSVFHFCAGTIPEALGALTELRAISLDGNELMGKRERREQSMISFEHVSFPRRRQRRRQLTRFIAPNHLLRDDALFSVLNACAGSLPKGLGSLGKLHRFRCTATSWSVRENLSN